MKLLTWLRRPMRIWIPKVSLPDALRAICAAPVIKEKK